VTCGFLDIDSLRNSLDFALHLVAKPESVPPRGSAFSCGRESQAGSFIRTCFA
jgi:hypothetical protein